MLLKSMSLNDNTQDQKCHKPEVGRVLMNGEKQKKLSDNSKWFIWFLSISMFNAPQNS